MARAPERVGCAVTMAAGHPAAVFANTMTQPHQMWKSRYAFLFQIPKLSDWIAKRHGFHYLHGLWEQWAAPRWTVPEAHWQQVKATLEKSWPMPLEHYREMAFSGPKTPLQPPTLYLYGSQDGCVEHSSADGQERFFQGRFESVAIEGAGHFMHLEKPEVVGAQIERWLMGRSKD